MISPSLGLPLELSVACHSRWHSGVAVDVLVCSIPSLNGNVLTALQHLVFQAGFQELSKLYFYSSKGTSVGREKKLF